MKTITKTYESSFRERGSKFMGYLFPAETETDFQEELDRLKSNILTPPTTVGHGGLILPNSKNSARTTESHPVRPDFPSLIK